MLVIIYNAKNASLYISHPDFKTTYLDSNYQENLIFYLILDLIISIHSKHTTSPQKTDRLHGR